MRLLMASLLLLSTGCASTLGGGRTSLVASVDDAPAGVAVRVNGLENADREIFYAPIARFSLDRASAYMVIAEAPGYSAAEKLIGRRLSAWLLLDVLMAVPFVAAGWPLSVRLIPGGPDILSATGGGLALGALAIDFATGSAWTHTEDRVRLRLQKTVQRQIN